MRVIRLIGKWVLIALGVLALAGLVRWGVRELNRPSDTEQVEKTLRYAETSGDPEVCVELQTDRYLRQVTGAPSIYADSHCRVSVENSEPASSIEIHGLKVDGDRATAHLTLIGGALDGSRLAVGLRKVGGDWRLDRLLSVDLDRPAYRRALPRTYLAAGWPAAAVSCVLGREKTLSTAAIEHTLLHRPPNPFVAIGVACGRGKVEEEILATIGAARIDSPGRAVSCARRHLRDASDSEVGATQENIAKYSRLVLACDPAAPFDFMRRELLAHEYLEPAAADCVIEASHRLSREDAYRLAFENDRYRAIIGGCRSES